MNCKDDGWSNSVGPVTNSKLKGRIKAIKEGQSCNGSSSVAGQLESYTLAQLRLQHETVERAHRERIEELKSHLAAVIDRTTRIRTAYDKEKRQLLSQLENLTADNRQAEEAWEAKLSRASESHAQALNARDRDIRILRQQYDEALQSNKRCKAEMCAQRLQLEDQVRREMKQKEQEHMAALGCAQFQQEDTSAELDRSRQETETLGQTLEAEKRHTEALSLQITTLCQELKDSKSLELAAQTEVKKWKEHVSQEQQMHKQDLEDAAVAAEARVHEVQKGRTKEMDEIEKKVKDVMERKNATIQRLQKSLDEANTRITVYEEEIHREKIRVLDQMKW